MKRYNVITVYDPWYDETRDKMVEDRMGEYVKFIDVYISLVRQGYDVFGFQSKDVPPVQ